MNTVSVVFKLYSTVNNEWESVWYQQVDGPDGQVAPGRPAISVQMGVNG